MQANLTKAAFGEPDAAPNAQDWPTYFNLSDVADRNARQQKTDPALGTYTQKVGGFKKDPASSTVKTPTNNPESKAIIGSGRVEYGSAPGSLEADFYTDMMKAAGYYFVQDYQSQRDRLTPGYTPPEPTKWQPQDPGVMGVPGGLLGRRDGGQTAEEKDVLDRVSQTQPRGSLIGEVDGVEYYTDGVKHLGSSISASVAGISISKTHDYISDTSGWKFGVSSKNPVLAVDGKGNVRVGGKIGVFDLGVIKYADGTSGVFGGASLGIKGVLSLGYRVHGGGESSGPHGTLSTYDHIAAYADGTIEKVEYSPGNHKHPYVKVTITTYDKNGNVIGREYNNIGSWEKAQEMGSGRALRIWEEPYFKGDR